MRPPPPSPPPPPRKALTRPNTKMITGPPSIAIGDVSTNRRIISAATKTPIVIVDPAYRIKGGTRIFSREEAEAYCSAFHVELENEFEEVDRLDLIKPMQGRMVTD